ncbi:UvrD-helicase domain-containing protein (plasmid) [Streptomyces sp. NBC_01707]|uniref:UvrD-helicase domain-containing protein n=1 Tax=Streptomyces sp. NBC_01707 TaxID=2975914 RepID=UPI002F910BD2
MSPSGRGPLTREQLIAAGTPHRRLYIEAAPGSGKTTVAAQRFGIQRFRSGNDPRAIIAVSFTRSATTELRSRVLSQWGPAALAWPHRIVTLDTIVCDLLTHLLSTGHVNWPAGHRSLTVIDHWRVLLPTTWSNWGPILTLDGDQVVARGARSADKDNRPTLADLNEALAGGWCTHQEVRRLLEMALANSSTRDVLLARLAQTVRALIVDEIFDANALDLALVRLAADAGLDITVVGDPWQALYGFRGARPDQVPALVEEANLVQRDLPTSFRWKSEDQSQLAHRLRAGEEVSLPQGHAEDVDVLLALQWNQLWDTGPHVLPLAYKSFKGQAQEAACTLLLSELTQRTFGGNATFHNDALTTLDIESQALGRLRPSLGTLLDDLAGTRDIDEILTSLKTVIGEESDRQIPRHHKTHRVRLEQLRARLRIPAAQLIPGLTAHQAKGREWDRVGVCLSSAEQGALSHGLNSGNEDHRKLYVALTRARWTTLAIAGEAP